MLDRFNLWPLLRANFGSTDPRIGRLRRVLSAMVSIAVPVGVGAVGAWFVMQGLQVSNGIAVALPAVSLLVGAMFGAFVFLTNLRVKLEESGTYAFRASLHKLVGSSAIGCLYVAIIALGTAGLLALVGSVPLLRAPELRPYVVGVIVALLVHVGMSLVVVFRRLFVVYFDMFAADFNPEIDPNPRPKKSRSKAPKATSQR